MEAIQQVLQNTTCPYNYASKRIQNIFIKWISQQKLDIDPQLPILPSPTNKCTKIMKPNDIYYKCYKCCQESPQQKSYFYFCSECFNPEDHLGHFYQNSYIQRGQQMYIFCICGKDITGEGTIHTCKNHMLQPQFEQMSKQLYQDIKYFYMPLFSIYYYLVTNKKTDLQYHSRYLEQLFNSICLSIHKLTYNSPKYCQIFIQLMINQQIQIPQTRYNDIRNKITMFDILVNEQLFMNKACQDVFLDIISCNKSAELFITQINNCLQNNNDRLTFQQRLNTQIQYLSEWIIDSMCQKNIYPLFLLNPSYIIYQKRKKDKQIIQKLLIKIINSDKYSECEKVNGVATFVCSTQMKLLDEVNLYIIRFLASYFKSQDNRDNVKQYIQLQVKSHLQEIGEVEPTQNVKTKKKAVKNLRQIYDQSQQYARQSDQQQEQQQEKPLQMMQESQDIQKYPFPQQINNLSQQNSQQQDASISTNPKKQLQQKSPDYQQQPQHSLSYLRNQNQQSIKLPVVMNIQQEHNDHHQPTPMPQNMSQLFIDSNFSKNKSETEEQPDIPKIAEALAQRIYSFCQGDKIRLINFRKQIKLVPGTKIISQSNIQAFLKWSIDNIDFGGSLESIPSIFVLTTIYLMMNSQNSKQFIDKLWNSILQQRSLQTIFNSIWNLIFVLTHNNFQRYKHYHICYSAAQIQSLKNEQHPIIQQLINMQKQYLYVNKQILISQAAELRKSLNINRFPQILNQYCRYDHDNNKFVYKSSEQHPSKLINLIKSYQLSDLQKQTKFTYIQNANNLSKLTAQSQQQKCMYKKLFIESQFYNKLSVLWVTFKNKLSDRQDLITYCVQSRILQIYLQIMILIRHLCGGQFIELQKQLEKMRKQPQKLNQLYILGKQQIVDHMLSMDQFKEQQIQKNNKTALQSKQGQNQERQLSEIKKKCLLKKNRIMNAYKNRRDNVINSMTESVMSLQRCKSIDQGQQCIICHEKSKVDNQLVLMFDLVKDSTLCSSIFLQNNCVNTFISSCFHAIHIDCFINTKGRNRYLKCPLCSKPQNTVFPLSYNNKSNRLNIVCHNILTCSAIITYDVYDIDNWFSVFLEYLIQSKCFCSMLQISKYQRRKKKRQKIDIFAQNNVEAMYKSAKQHQKIVYQHIIDKLQERIKKCPNEIYRDIQNVLLNAICCKIKGQQDCFKISEIRQLQTKLKQQQFKILVKQIQEIIGQLPNKQQNQNAAPLNKQSLSTISFALKRLPNTWNQLPKFGGDKCQMCSSQQKAFVCLICGDTLCNNCLDSDNHEQKHKKRIMGFYFSEAQIRLKTQCSALKADLYLNPLRVSVSQFSVAGQKDDIFRFDERTYQKVQDIFLDDL